MNFKGNPNTLLNTYKMMFGKLKLINIGEFDSNGILELSDDSPYIPYVERRFKRVEEEKDNAPIISPVEEKPVVDENKAIVEDKPKKEAVKNGNKRKTGHGRGSKTSRTRKQSGNGGRKQGS